MRRVVLLFVAVWIAALPMLAQQSPVQGLEGKPMPAFVLEDVAGQKVALEQFKGRAVMISLWATWCAPCRAEVPWLIALRNQYKDEGFELLAISEDDFDASSAEKLASSRAIVAHYAERLHLPYPVLLNGQSLPAPLGGLDSLPTALYVNREGVVVATSSGIVEKDEIERKIRLALGK